MKGFFFLTIYSAISLYSGITKATITPVQSLSFGKIAVTNNQRVSSIAIDPVGNVQVDGGIAVLEDGNHAIYELSDFPPNRVLDIDVRPLNTEMIPDVSSEETFEISISTNSATLITNNAGIALLSFGGKIETSGSGFISFTDTQYQSTIQITVNF